MDEKLAFLNHDRRDNIRDCSARATREALAASLRGQVVRIPDLRRDIEQWPAAVHSEVERLRRDLEDIIKQQVSASRRREKLIAADPGYFAASWWPHASYDRLLVAAQLSLWLFAWDDEMDSAEFSDRIHSLERGQRFRERTLTWIRASLEVEWESSRDIGESVRVSDDPINALFAPVAFALVKEYSQAQRQVLMTEIEVFIRMCGVEQQVQLKEGLPSVECYWRRRRGSSAVLVVLAIHEFTLETPLPWGCWQQPLLQSFCEETNMIISATNDILSFKKEFAQNQVDSLVPLLCHQYKIGAQEAVDMASQIVRMSVERMGHIACEICSQQVGRDAHKALMAFVDSCKYACTANLKWSIMSGRYDLDLKKLEDGILLAL